MLAAARAVPRDLARHAQELIDLATGDRDVELRAALFSLTDLLEETASDREPVVRAPMARRGEPAMRGGRSRPRRTRRNSAGRAASFPES